MKDSVKNNVTKNVKGDVKNSMKHSAAALALLLSCASLAFGAAAQAHQPKSFEPRMFELNNGTVHAKVTDAMGGRLLAFSLVGKPNFLKTDEAAGDPRAPIDAFAGNVGYLGHEMWVGPQSQWWSHQSVNPARAAEKAHWPPDPFLSLAPYTVRRAGAGIVDIDSVVSPVSGLQLNKQYQLVAGKPNSLRLDVAAVNRRDTSVAWDIWFNTRTHADTRVYVPVAAQNDIRVNTIEGFDAAAPLTYTLERGIFSLDMLAPPAGKDARSGKVLLQPSYGWLAGFHSGQAFIIQFAHQAKSAIHPEQGQVELFNDYQPGQPDKGLLEMEVHAPYKTLAPGARMSSSETWTIFPYSGEPTRAAHIAFLASKAKALKLGGL